MLCMSYGATLATIDAAMKWYDDEPKSWRDKLLAHIESTEVLSLLTVHLVPPVIYYIAFTLIPINYLNESSDDHSGTK